jgi:hypothetical protein
MRKLIDGEQEGNAEGESRRYSLASGKGDRSKDQAPRMNERL